MIARFTPVSTTIPFTFSLIIIHNLRVDCIPLCFCTVRETLFSTAPNYVLRSFRMDTRTHSAVQSILCARLFLRLRGAYDHCEDMNTFSTVMWESSNSPLVIAVDSGLSSTSCDRLDITEIL